MDEVFERGFLVIRSPILNGAAHTGVNALDREYLQRLLVVQAIAS